MILPSRAAAGGPICVSGDQAFTFKGYGKNMFILGIGTAFLFLLLVFAAFRGIIYCIAKRLNKKAALARAAQRDIEMARQRQWIRPAQTS
jgi:Na+-transporting methylmalonyl-CoA/oxaloacetate decarboxylase gamma subunit